MSDFKSLTSELEPWFDKPFEELPEEIRELIKRRFPPAEDWNSGDPRRGLPKQFVSAWNSFTPDQRREAAAWSDRQRDPAHKAENDAEWDLIVRLLDLQADLKKIETGPSTDEARRQERRDNLSRQIADIEARLREPVADAAPLTPVADAAPLSPVAVDPSTDARAAAGAAASTAADDIERGDRTAPVYKSGAQGRNKGGRPPREDQERFNQEVTSRLALDGGNMTLTQFRKQMKDWADENLKPEPPDDRTVERWIDKLVPPGLLPE
jgi:hypothetical protein